MQKWKITFLISGFKIDNNIYKVGNVEFTNNSKETHVEISLLEESANFCKFPFRLNLFPRAHIIVEDDDYKHAAMRALIEIDRTLDTFAFSYFSQCKYLPIGYVKNVDSEEAHPIKYKESHVPMPLEPSFLSEMSSVNFSISYDYIKHFEHLLLKQPHEFTESNKKLATALRWCRLGSLSRYLSESSTVAFIFEWIALETLLTFDENDTNVTIKLKRLPKLMKHFSEKIIFNYSKIIETNIPSNNEQIWNDKIFKMYEDRKDIFHEGHMSISIDFLNLLGPKEYKGDIGILEAILSRVLPFIAKGSKNFSIIKGIWDNLNSYSPKDEDEPVTNLGGWSEAWV
jgi:hypothetical protein